MIRQYLNCLNAFVLGVDRKVGVSSERNRPVPLEVWMTTGHMK